jgi:hypothetical protein
MTYRTVFDVSQNGYAAWWFPAFGLIFVFLAAGAVMGLPGLRWGQRGRVKDWFSLGFTVFWTLAVLGATFADYRDAVSKLREGKYAVVEGPVSDFAALPKGGWWLDQKAETFVVDGRRFTYSGAVVTAGFHQMASQGGPIHEGLQVRIAYSGSEILRLEIAQ